jgi:hypothetical protein
VMIGSNVTSLGDGAFWGCYNLTGIYFQGNAPGVGSSVFDSDNRATIYYLPGTTGWGPTFDGLPTAVWCPPPPYTCTTNNGAITITGYTGSGGDVTIPDTINGLPVTSLAYEAFYNCPGLTSVTIPAGVTSLGSGAFDDCPSLTGVYFRGNAPSVGSSMFCNDNHATVYYLPGATGWGNFAQLTGLPTVLWNPQVRSDASLGVQTNQFGFNISGSAGLVLVVEACTNFASPVWQPVQTNILTGGSSYFSDPQWTNYPGRFYRIRSP